MDFESFKKDFADRLRNLRSERNISAREMSIELGQNVNYINYIENGKHMPSMQGFFSICEYLNIKPAEFLNTSEYKILNENSNLAILQKLSDRQLKSVLSMLHEFIK